MRTGTRPEIFRLQCWHIRYLADIRGIGRCDIVGFGDGGVVVSKNDGDAQFNPVYIALSDFGYTAGDWRLEHHLLFLEEMAFLIL